MRSNFFRPALILRWTPGAIFSGRLCQIAGRQVISTRSSQPLALLTAKNSLASAPQAMNRVFGPSAITFDSAPPKPMGLDAAFSGKILKAGRGAGLLLPRPGIA